MSGACEPRVFISKHYHEFHRKARDFALTLTLFSIAVAKAAALSGSFAANLPHDVSTDCLR
jgi:hypothetical protein